MKLIKLLSGNNLVQCFFLSILSCLCLFLSQKIVHNFYYHRIGAVLFFISFFSAVYAIVHLFLFVLKKPLDSKINILLSTTTCMFIFLFLELFLRLFSINATYGEKNSGKYYPFYLNEQIPTHYWVHEANDHRIYLNKEFEYNRQTNSLGLSEKEIETPKSQEFRIIAIGDSFTEGVGVNYDSTWLKKTEAILQSQYKDQSIRTINAGIGGSDPVYECKLLNDKLLSYKPNLVVLSMNTSDIADISYRGGEERFKADGTCGKVPPKWEWIYSINYTTRLIVHRLLRYSDYLVSYSESKEGKKKSVKIILDTCKKLKALSKENNFKLLFIIHPTIDDFKEKRYSYQEMGIVSDSLTNRKYNFLEMKQYFTEQGIKNKNDAQQYYWPIDRHFNQKGYDFYGELVAEKIIEYNWIPEDKKRDE